MMSFETQLEVECSDCEKWVEVYVFFRGRTDGTFTCPLCSTFQGTDHYDAFFDDVA